jgi:selenocysteine lyase/cysteine desulfurase
MTTHLQLEAEVGGYEAAAQAQEQIDATYAALAQLLGGRRDEVALFDNSTHAWNAAFYSVPVGPGDRILTGRDEYSSNVLAYLQVARRSGAEIVPSGRHPGRRPVPRRRPRRGL